MPLPTGAQPSLPFPGAPAAPAPIPAPAAPPLPIPGAPPAPGGFPPPPTAKFAVPGQPAAPGSVTALPFEAVKIKGSTKAPFSSTQAPFSPTQAPFTQPPFEEPPKSRAGVYIGIGVAGAVVFAVIAVLVNAHLEKIKAKDEADAAALALRVNEQRLIEAQKAADEEKAQHEKELQMAVDITRQQTEEETRRQVLEQVEAERLAKLPGTLIADTSPSGATISIDGATAMNTPIKLDGVPPGTHKILITKPGFENVEMTIEVKGSKTKDLGTVALETSLGSVDISSTPDSLEYAIRPASQSLGKPVRTGKTPATIDDLPHGDYIVTISRPGCRDHVSKLTIEKGGHTTVDTKYVDGALELTSDPSGAWVAKDGTTIGSTPLSLHDLTPKTAHFELTLPGYDTTPVTCEIPEGQTLKLNAELLRKDRVFKSTEVKTGPIPVESPQPVLSAEQKKLGGDILLSLIVRRDGSVSDVTVEKATDDDIGRRCQATVGNWKYRPATADDDRTVDARIEVPFKFTPQN
jgi:TonB family protein